MKRLLITWVLLVSLSVLFFGFAPVVRSVFGESGGAVIHAYTLENANGMLVRLLDYGATIQSILVPDRKGQVADVILGYSDLEGYVEGGSYFGSTIGRYSGRLGKGQFEIDGRVYTLPINDGPNTLHGGFNGFHKRLWNAIVETVGSFPSVRMTYSSPNGEEGFPGTLVVTVHFTLTDDNELIMDYEAFTDRPTVLNPTNHAYFNLRGEGNGDILSHILHVSSDFFAETDEMLIPTGSFCPVEGTVLDFRTPLPVGARLDVSDRLLAPAKGYDHSFLFMRSSANGLVLSARLYEPDSGRALEVWTTEPDLHVYTGNFLEGVAGKHGSVYGPYTGICLETQHFPDSPNRPEFPSTRLNPGDRFQSRTIYRFMILP